MLEETPKTIRVSFETYRELSQLGTCGDSFDSVIRSLLSNQNQNLVVEYEDLAKDQNQGQGIKTVQGKKAEETTSLNQNNPNTPRYIKEVTLTSVV